MKRRKGFTLMELMVVVLILGILASLAVPQYYKAIETSKATDAMAIGHMLCNANRMFLVDNPAVVLSGTMSNACNTGACNTASTSVCRLVQCNYAAAQDWDSGAYTYSMGGGLASYTRRRTTPPIGTTRIPFNGWGYNFSLSGGCTTVGGAPACMGF